MEDKTIEIMLESLSEQELEDLEKLLSRPEALAPGREEKRRLEERGEYPQPGPRFQLPH